MPTHQPLDPSAAYSAALGTERGIDPRAAVTLTIVVVDAFDLGQQCAIGHRSQAFRARTPIVVTCRRHSEHRAHDSHRILLTAIFDETESHVRVPAKIAIDFFKMSRSMRSRSFSCTRRAISAA